MRGCPARWTAELYLPRPGAPAGLRPMRAWSCGWRAGEQPRGGTGDTQAKACAGAPSFLPPSRSLGAGADLTAQRSCSALAATPATLSVTPAGLMLVCSRGAAAKYAAGFPGGEGGRRGRAGTAVPAPECVLEEEEYCEASDPSKPGRATVGKQKPLRAAVGFLWVSFLARGPRAASGCGVGR